MLTYLMTIVLGAVQGFTAILPISSFGHVLIAAELFGWPIITAQAVADESHMLTLFGVVNVSIGILLAIQHRAYWAKLLGGLRVLMRGDRPNEHNFAGRLCANIFYTAGIVTLATLLLQHAARTAFAKVFFTIIFLAVNGIILASRDQTAATGAVSRSRNRSQASAVQSDEHARSLRLIADHIKYAESRRIGLWQISSLLPGISQPGLSILAAMRNGLDRQQATLYALLVASPVLVLTGLPQIHHLFSAGLAPGRLQMFAGVLAALVTAFAGLRFLPRFVKRYGIRPLGWYCVGMALFMLVMAIVRGSVQR